MSQSPEKLSPDKVRKRAVVFSVDDAFVLPFKVLFNSLAHTGSLPPQTGVFILHESGLSDPAIADLMVFFESYDVVVSFLDVGDHLPDNLPLDASAHVSKAAFYRLFVAKVLPDSFSSALYLDSDAVAVRSMRSLLEIELTAPIAAVDHYSPTDQLRIWGDAGGGYFQSGVVLIDLDQWRKGDIEEHFIEIMQTKRSLIRWWDQDVLNIAFRDNWQRLDVWFNVAQCSIRYLPPAEVANNARYLHFDGSSKPWSTDIHRPYRDRWYEAYERMAGHPFDLSRIRRPLLRRVASKAKAIGKPVWQEISGRSGTY
jgi:lipopolysaccharide biosynthesis glycosyltransferase